MKRTELVVVFAVLALAVAMRFCGLSWAPPGLHPDEGLNGTNAAEASATGDYAWYYPEGGGREGLIINAQAVAVGALGNTAFALRLVSALAGVLTVLGVYLLARRMFDDWRIAAIAAFLISVGFWHVLASRVATAGVLSPLFAVWGFYYLYKGIETHRLWHWGLAGLLFGAGFHGHVAYRVVPAAIALTLIALWLSLRAVFSHSKYLHARHQMLGGVAAMIGIMVIVMLPMVTYFYANPQDVTGGSQTASWAGEQPAADTAREALRVFGMFFVTDTGDWKGSIATEPLLFWPVAAFFAAGLAHTLWRFGHSWRTRGHPGVVHTLLLSWFFVGLIPELLFTGTAPAVHRILLVAPAVYILAAVGLHWCYLALERWYGHSDRRQICLPMKHFPGGGGHRLCMDRSTFVVTVAVLSVLFAIGVGDARRYFVTWAQEPAVAEAYAARYLDVVRRLSSLPPAALKYVVVTRGDTDARGMPSSAQSVMFLTDSWSPESQRARNIYYLTQQQFESRSFPRGAIVIRLDP